MNLNSRNIAIALSLLFVGAILYFFRDIVSYVLIAWVFSLLGQPLMKFFLKKVRIGKRHLPPSVCALLTMITYFLAIVGLVSFFVPLIVEQANHLYELDTNKITAGLKDPIDQLTSWGKRFGLLKRNESIVDFAQHSFDTWLKPFSLSSLFNAFFNTASNMIVGTVSVGFISFFFLKETGMFTDFLAHSFPKQYENNVRETLRDTTTLLSRYISGLFLQMLFVIVFLGAALFIIGLKNIILITIFAAIINIVPYLGPMLSCAFAVTITITSNIGLDFYTQIVPIILKVVFVFGLMQFINDWIVQPLIFSNRVLAHPLEIFIVTLIGAKIGGIPGMILAIPSYTVLRVIGREFFNQYRFVQKITSGLSDSEILKDSP
jgi:predicted PurR-regulated permease PerM